MDQTLWPTEKKTVRGNAQGTPFEETYQPKRDIAGDFTVDVTYGFAAGQDPARAIVGLLQLRGDQLISRDFFQRQLPMNIDVVAMQTQIDLEQLTDAAKQGIMAYAQAILPMAQQGGADPTVALENLTKLMGMVEKGTPIIEAMSKVFTPKPQPGQGQPQDALQALLGGGQPPGAPGQQAPPQGGPGGAPGASQQPQGLDMQTLLSGLTSKGEAQMSARSQRQAPI